MKLLHTIAAVSLMFSGVVVAAEKVIIEGSTTVLPIAQACAERLMEKNGDLNITVRGGGSGVGIASIIDSTCTIGDSSRPIKGSEIKKALDKGVDPKGNVIAMDGIAVIVNPANPIKAFTKKQIKDIYTGAISDWLQLGGTPGKIVVLSRDTSSGTYEAFSVLALSGAKPRADALLQASNQAAATTVAKTPQAVGYVGLGYVSGSVKAIPVEGVECSKATVLSAQYPYSRPLYMYTNGKPQGNAKFVIDFVLSDEGQKIVEEQGFVPLK
ncbi:MAG: phosphate ABC transporter substrate-binding protein [Candidatus Firestonebacteria bacterium]